MYRSISGAEVCPRMSYVQSDLRRRQLLLPNPQRISLDMLDPVSVSRNLPSQSVKPNVSIGRLLADKYIPHLFVALDWVIRHIVSLG